MMLPRRKLLAAGALATASLALRSARSPTARAQASPGDLLYEANWWAGWDGWPEGLGWQVFDGAYINDGSGSSYRLFAACPYVPADHGFDNYAVEAELRIDTTALNSAVALVARGHYFGSIYHGSRNQSGMFLSQGEASTNSRLSNTRYESVPVKSGEQHAFRLEARGNRFTFKLDGATVVQGTDNRYLSGGEVGLLCKENQVSVSAFRVNAL